MDDRELLRLLRADPEEGFRQLMDLYMSLVYSVVRARLGQVATPEDVEDCVSEAFAEFYHSLARVDLRRGTVKAYLCTIARRRAIDCYERLVVTAPQLSLEDAEDRQAAADAFSLEEELITAETRRAVVEAIASLPSPDREIIVGKFLLGEPSRSIAARLHMTVSAVDTRAHRALRKLRARWEEKDNEKRPI